MKVEFARYGRIAFAAGVPVSGLDGGENGGPSAGAIGVFGFGVTHFLPLRTFPFGQTHLRPLRTSPVGQTHLPLLRTKPFLQAFDAEAELPLPEA